MRGTIDKRALLISLSILVVGLAIIAAVSMLTRPQSQAATGASAGGASTQGSVAQLPTGVATPPPPMATDGLPFPLSTYSPIAGATEQAAPKRSEPAPAYDPSRFTPSPIPPLRQASFATWSYTASRDELGNLFAFITRDTKTLAALQTFAADNKQSATQLAGSGKDVEVYITFRNYVTVAQFREWAKAQGLQVQAVGLRTVDACG